jgi:hypothetical protein
MLPIDVKVEHLDEGMKDLVVNINRIPSVHTLTNCEGEIWRESTMPTKDGWLYFIKKPEVHEGLVKIIQTYCGRTPNFSFEGPEKDHIHPFYGGGFDFYAVKAMFEQIDENIRFCELSKRDQEDYYKKAEVRKADLLKGWAGLNQEVLKYIMAEVSPEVESLPFVDEKVELYRDWVCPHHDW